MNSQYNASLSQRREKMAFLYGDRGENTCDKLEKILIKFLKKINIPDFYERFSERDVVLIAYGDMIQDSQRPLQELCGFARKYLKDKINTIHILPFFKYDSDRGFSIIDYREVDSNLGEWDDLKEFKRDFKLMFDLVLNHVSDKHTWFHEFKKGSPKFRDYFIWFDSDNLPPQEDLQKVFRPRISPLLRKYETSDGEKYVWTTFPLNQVDLNFKNEEVLLDIIETMLFYVSKGADIIRLDAIAFIWKELGTSCVHLKQTHVIVQLLRDVLNAVAPHVSLITETNVPHKENMEYFGDGGNEAQMVYNFTLPPLIIHSLYTGEAMNLSEWACQLEIPSEENTFFNILDSHDGIGVMGVKDILTDKEIEEMVRQSEAYGGLVGYKKNPDGTESPYEMNTTWWCALNSCCLKAGDDLETQMNRYLVSRSIALCLKGIPGIYLNGLLGALNDRTGFKKTGNKRDINRKNFIHLDLEKEIIDLDSRVHILFFRFLNLIEKRGKEEAFHPKGSQEILFLNESVFTIKRTSPDKRESIITIHNLSQERQKITLEKNSYYDVLSQKTFPQDIELLPYQIVWLKKV